MITILFISHVSVLGGAERSLLAMLSRLDRDRFLPIVVCPSGHDLPCRLSRLGVRTEFLDFVRFKRGTSMLVKLKYAARYFLLVVRLARIVSRVKADVIHANSTTAQLYGAVAACIRRIPSIWHVRDVVPPGMVGFVLYRMSTRIIVPSRAVEEVVDGYRGSRRRARSGGTSPAGRSVPMAGIARGGRPHGKVRRIPNGIDVDHWNARRFANGGGGESVRLLRERFGAVDDACVVGMVAALVPWKQHRTFINAAREVRRRYDKTAFVIVGGDLFADHPAYRDELQKLCGESGLSDSITFTGNVEDVTPVMAACDIIVLPSLNEPFGRVIIEAMALQKPVIAAGTGGPRDIIENGVTGMCVDPCDAGGVAGAMMELVEDTGRRRAMGLAGRARVEKLFGIDRVMSDVESLYEAIARVNAV